MRSVLFLVFLCGFITPSYAQHIPDPVQAKILSDVISVKPGESFNLGVLFEIDPGWYIYWKNPGDTGLPTKVSFDLPPNYKSGELNWPTPLTFQNSRGGEDYGYKDSVLLWMNIEVPSNAHIDSKITIQSEVSWLSCKDICIPGKASLKYTLSIADFREQGNEDLFSKWQDRLDD